MPNKGDDIRFESRVLTENIQNKKRHKSGPSFPSKKPLGRQSAYRRLSEDDRRAASGLFLSTDADSGSKGSTLPLICCRSSLCGFTSWVYVHDITRLQRAVPLSTQTIYLEKLPMLYL